MGEKTANRIVTIDALRSFAILSMVFGHTTNIVLADQFRTNSFLLYGFHYHLSGLIAPVFFFTSGMIFTYLLFKTSESFNLYRFIKGSKRTLYLLLVGFLIQIPIFNFVNNPLEFVHYSHVLQCIGLSIFLICLIYLVSFAKWKIFSIITILLFNIAFLVYPFLHFYYLDFQELNLLSLFLSERYTEFPLIPWTGFSLAGAFFGVLFIKVKFITNLKFLIGLIIFGVILSFESWLFLKGIYSINFENVGKIIDINIFTYFRLGEVLITFSIVSMIVKYIKIPNWLLIPGKETLLIYIFHNIIVFGSLFGLGYNSYIYHKLTFFETTLVNIFTLAICVILSNYIFHRRAKYKFLRIIK